MVGCSITSPTGGSPLSTACVTWGGVVLVTWPFVTKYCDEGWAVLTHELAEKGRDTLGLDPAQLDADLNDLAWAA
jgi:hypothetical protein